jgi:hypothetical protein
MSGKAGKAKPAGAQPSKKVKKAVDEEARAAAAAAAAAEDAMSSGTESDEVDDDDEDDDSSVEDGLDMTREGGDDDEEESDDEDEDGEDNTVTVEFNFMDPREIHYKSVRRLLEHFLPGEEESFNVSAMADAIVAQVALGTMVTVNDDALDVYAFATVLPVALYKVRSPAGRRQPRGLQHFRFPDAATHLHHPLSAPPLVPHPLRLARSQDTDWMASIRKYVLAKAREGGSGLAPPALAALVAAWEDPASSGLGLLVNERVINMPPELAPAIHESLAADLAWAAGNAPGKEAFAGVKQLLLLAPCFSERASESEIAAHAAAVADAGAAGAGRKTGAAAAGGKKARKPRHAAAAAGKKGASSSSSAAAGGDDDASDDEDDGAAAAASSSSSSSSSSAAPAAAAAKVDPLGLGPGWLTHYLHFEEELYAAQAGGASFAFRVKDFEKDASAAAAAGGIGAGEGAGAGSKKRKAQAAAASSSSGSSSAAAPDDVAPTSSSLRAPASRRVVLFPTAALPVCVEAMKHLLVEAQAGAGAAPSSSSSAAAAAGPAGGKKGGAAAGRR